MSQTPDTPRCIFCGLSKESVLHIVGVPDAAYAAHEFSPAPPVAPGAGEPGLRAAAWAMVDAAENVEREYPPYAGVVAALRAALASPPLGAPKTARELKAFATWYFFYRGKEDSWINAQAVAESIVAQYLATKDPNDHREDTN